MVRHRVSTASGTVELSVHAVNQFAAWLAPGTPAAKLREAIEESLERAVPLPVDRIRGVTGKTPVPGGGYLHDTARKAVWALRPKGQRGDWWIAATVLMEIDQSHRPRAAEGGVFLAATNSARERFFLAYLPFRKNGVWDDAYLTDSLNRSRPSTWKEARRVLGTPGLKADTLPDTTLRYDPELSAFWVLRPSTTEADALSAVHVLHPLYAQTADKLARTVVAAREEALAAADSTADDPSHPEGDDPMAKTATPPKPLRGGVSSRPAAAPIIPMPPPPILSVAPPTPVPAQPAVVSAAVPPSTDPFPRMRPDHPLRELLPFLQPVPNMPGVLGGAVTVTPQMAGRLIAATTLRNRDKNRANLWSLMRQMKNGEWRLNGQPWQFDEVGELWDGNHRAHSCRDSGVTIQTEIKVGIPADARTVTDTGTIRTLKDYLAMAGETNVAMLSATARLVWLWERGQLARIKMAAKREGLTPVAQEQLLDRHPGLRDAVSRSSGYYQRFRHLPRSLWAFCVYAFGRIDATKRTEWCDMVCGAADAPVRSGPGLLRNRLVSQSTSTRLHKLEPVVILAMAIKSWRLYATGQEAARLLWMYADKRAEPFPAVDPRVPPGQTDGPEVTGAAVSPQEMADLDAELALAFGGRASAPDPVDEPTGE